MRKLAVTLLCILLLMLAAGCTDPEYEAEITIEIEETNEN